MLGASAKVTYHYGYPAVINTEREAEIARQAAVQAFGEERVQPMKPMMGGEDFSYYLRKVPGAYLFVGAGNPDKLAKYPHHHPRFDIDEDAMLIAAELLGRTALLYLEQHGS